MLRTKIVGSLTLVLVLAACAATTAAAGSPTERIRYAVATSDGWVSDLLGTHYVYKGERYPVASSAGPAAGGTFVSGGVRPDTFIGCPQGYGNIDTHWWHRQGWSSVNLRSCHYTSSALMGTWTPAEGSRVENGSATNGSFVCSGGWGTALWIADVWTNWFSARPTAPYWNASNQPPSNDGSGYTLC